MNAKINDKIASPESVAINLTHGVRVCGSCAVETVTILSRIASLRTLYYPHHFTQVVP